MQPVGLRPLIEVKVGRFVLKPPELAAMLARLWISRWASIIGFSASIQVRGSWGTKNPYLSHEHPSVVAPAGGLSSISHRLGFVDLDAVSYTLDSMGRRIAITRPGAKNDSYGTRKMALGCLKTARKEMGLAFVRH
jgi:hypothetical protein